MLDGTLVIKLGRWKVGPKNGTQVPGGKGMSSDDEGVRNSGVKEMTRGDMVSSEKGKTISSTTVNNF
jgi:hypothetical protein